MVQGISVIRNYYIRQKELWVLDHAILCTIQFSGNERFAILLGDVVVYNDEKPALCQLIDIFGYEC